MKKIRTVCGDITPEELGTTMIHEHAFIDLRTSVKRISDFFPNVTEDQLKLEMRNLKFLQTGGWALSQEALDPMSEGYIDYIVKELEEYKAVGGNAICECSVYGLMGRPYEDLALVSKKSGVHIIYGVGMYMDFCRPEKFLGKSEDEIKVMFESDLDNGFEHSGIKPGFLKATFSGLTAEGKPLPGELDVYRAVVRISAERNMPMMVHLSVPPLNGDIIVELAKLALSLGANPKKVLFCHVQQLINCPDGIPDTCIDYIKTHKQRFDIEVHKRLLELGINISFDSFGNACTLPFELGGGEIVSDYAVVGAIYELLKLGYEKQIMAGHDFGDRISGKTYGGYGYTRVPTFVCNMLKQLGYEEAAHRLVVDNPAEFLAF